VKLERSDETNSLMGRAGGHSPRYFQSIRDAHRPAGDHRLLAISLRSQKQQRRFGHPEGGDHRGQAARRQPIRHLQPGDGQWRADRIVAIAGREEKKKREIKGMVIKRGGRGEK